MQHDQVLKKLYVDHFTPSPGTGGVGGSVGKACYYVTACVIPLNLIRNILKKLNFDLLTQIVE